MDDKVNYPLVGGFVLVLGALLVVAVLWLSAGLGKRHALDRYQAYIEESVAGLSLNAPVKYLGVDVGKVARINIDPNNSQRVQLLFLVDEGTPIKQDTMAVLKAQGLTGIAYVELNGGSAASPLLQPKPEGEPPTIPFKLSLSARLESVLGQVVGNVNQVTQNVNAVLDADNRAALKAALADVAAFSHAMAAQRMTLARGITDGAQAARLAAKAGERLDPTLQRISEGAQAVTQLGAQAGDASQRAGRAADLAASAAQQLGGETLPDAARLIAELARLSTALRLLSEQTTRQPSSLLVGRPLPLPGPGESAPP